jgi:hypothetical protein
MHKGWGLETWRFYENRGSSSDLEIQNAWVFPLFIRELLSLRDWERKPSTLFWESPPIFASGPVTTCGLYLLGRGGSRSTCTRVFLWPPWVLNCHRARLAVDLDSPWVFSRRPLPFVPPIQPRVGSGCLCLCCWCCGCFLWWWCWCLSTVVWVFWWCLCGAVVVGVAVLVVLICCCDCDCDCGWVCVCGWVIVVVVEFVEVVVFVVFLLVVVVVVLICWCLWLCWHVHHLHL